MTMCSTSWRVPVRWLAGMASARWMAGGKAEKAVAAPAVPASERRKWRRDCVMV
jgi:hypothetical protein